MKYRNENYWIISARFTLGAQALLRIFYYGNTKSTSLFIMRNSSKYVSYYILEIINATNKMFNVSLLPLVQIVNAYCPSMCKL